MREIIIGLWERIYAVLATFGIALLSAAAFYIVKAIYCFVYVCIEALIKKARDAK